MSKIREYEFTLTGNSPLLMHADNVESSDELAAWRKDPANKNKSVSGDDRSPAWTYISYGYWDDDGNLVMPFENLMACLRMAAARVILKGQKSFKEISQAGVLPVGENADFYCGDRQLHINDFADREDDFETHREKAKELGLSLFIKRAKVGQSKHVRVRPKFKDWTVVGRLQVTADELTESVLKQIFEIAGRSIGLGDWRPGGKTPGSFGLFNAELVAV